jgi:UDP-glucuronate 4-epimerase
MPRILVTGAAGFIGRATSQALRGANRDYLAADKSSSGPVVACDLEDPASLKSLFTADRFDAIIHLAAVLPGAASVDPFKAARVNVGASLALLDAAMASGVPRFIFGSSTSVYGSAGLNSPISEEMPASPCDVYGGAKRFVEIVGVNLHQQGKIEFVSLRIATVVGPGARHTSSPWRSEIFEKLGSRTRQAISLPYSIEDPLTVVHVDDVGCMLVRLAEAKSVRETVYNTPAELISAGDLKRLIEKVDPQIEVQLAGRSRPPAPLADGSRFAKEFGFEIPSLESKLKKHASGS